MAEARHDWLRREDKESTKANFPELFFDLVFVFALIQLSETLAADFTFGIAGRALLFILALWWVWIHTTWLTNLLDVEVIPVRLLLFALMFLGILLAIALPRAFGDMGLLFALTYSAMQIGRSLFALYALYGTDHASYRTFVRITVWLSLSCLVWIAGAFLSPDIRVMVWIVALAIEYLGPLVGYWLPGMGRAPPETLAIKGEHLAERCALFVIIALGETVLTTGKIASAHMENPATPLVLASAFLSTVLMWWLYFHDGQERVADKAEESPAPQRTAQHLFAYGHLPIVAGMILTAVGEDFSISHPDQKGSIGEAMALIGGPILFLAGTAWMKTIASHLVPPSHVTGVILLAGAFLVAPFLPNIATQGLANLVLFAVALWEYLALRRARRSVA